MRYLYFRRDFWSDFGTWTLRLTVCDLTVQVTVKAAESPAARKVDDEFWRQERLPQGNRSQSRWGQKWGIRIRID